MKELLTLNCRCRLVFLIAMTLLPAFFLSNWQASALAAAASYRGRTVTWAPKVVEVTIFRGAMQSFAVGFNATRELDNVSFFVVPEISNLFFIEETEPNSVLPGLSYVLPVTVEIPLSTPLGIYEGTVHLRVKKRTVPDTLKVVINVVAPSSVVAPEGVNLCSSDRITTADGQKLIKDEIVVGLEFEILNPDERITEIALMTGAVILGSVPATLTYQLQYVVANLDSLEQIRILIEDLPGVEFASHHFVTETPSAIPNDTEYDEDDDGDFEEHWDEDNPGGNNWNLEYIQAPTAWDTTTGTSDIVVAIIDNDFDDDHGDLDDNIVSLSGARTDVGGHGTHVAGIIGAEGNNDRGVTGVSWDCSLRLYDIGSGSLQILALSAQQAMVQAVNEGARIVNMSLQWIDNNQCGTPGTNNTLQRVSENNAILGRAILYAERENLDVFWVFAAGNECRDSKYASPASLTFNFPLKTMAVASVNDNGQLSAFSNFGDLVTVAAPGENILSTTPRSCPIPFLPIFCSDQYDTMSGTSMAAPHVSGLAALVWSEHPDFSASQVKQCILSAAQSIGTSIPGHDFRVINAPGAVECDGTVVLPAEVDMVFAIDLTGSMGAEISRVKAEIDDIITHLTTVASPSTDFRFGVVSYEDYAGFFDSTPCGSIYARYYGYTGTKPDGDAPFRIDHILTDDSEAIVTTINGLQLGSGGDGPQSYGRVFWELGQTDTGSALGFRADALKLVVNFGDNVPHDTDLNEDIASPPFTTFDTGVDPGRDNTVDCNGDDIDFQDDALVAMLSGNIRLLHIDSSGNSSFIPYWQFWTSVTGGAFAAINSDGSIPGGLDLTDLIIDLLQLIPD